MEKSNSLSAGPIKDNGTEYKLNFNVTVPPLAAEKMPKIMAYAFDSKNRLMEIKEVPGKGGGRVEFTLRNQKANDKVRVIVGPHLEVSGVDDTLCIAKKLPQGIRPKPSVTPKMLLSKGGIETKVRLNNAQLDRDIILLAEDALIWTTCRCTVKGRLVKEMKLPDGAIKEMGVYQACIYIWEADRWYYVLQQLPEWELLRLRDDLIDVLQRWPPVPWPPQPEPVRMATLSVLNRR